MTSDDKGSMADGPARADCAADGPALSPPKRRMWIGLCCCVLLYGALFGTLRVQRMRTFFSFEWEDEALHVQVMWNLVHGRGFVQTLWPQPHELHLRPALLLLAPFCAPYPHIETQYYLFSLLIGAGAVPVFFWARQIFKDDNAGLLAVLGWLLYPPIHFITWASLDTVTLAAPLICLAFYAVERRRLVVFHVSLLLIVACKENLAATALLLGVYAGLRKRDARWWAPYLVIAPIYLLVATLVVFPTWASSRSFVPASGMVTSLSRLREIDANPMFALAKLATLNGKWQALLMVFGPVLFLGLLRPVYLMGGLACAFQVWLLRNPLGPAQGHHITPLATVAFLASIAAIGRIQNRGSRWRQPRILLAVLLIALVAGNLVPNRIGAVNPVAVFDEERANATNIFDPVYYRMQQSDPAAWRVLRRLPARVSVAATGHLLPWIAGRPFVASFPPKHGGADVLEKVEYILADKRLKKAGAGNYPSHKNDPRENARILEEAKRFALRTERYELVAEDGPCYLLRRLPGRVTPKRPSLRNAADREDTRRLF